MSLSPTEIAEAIAIFNKIMPTQEETDRLLELTRQHSDETLVPPYTCEHCGEVITDDVDDYMELCGSCFQEREENGP